MANLPDGRYLISVLADGYKIDGAHFTVPLADPGLVTVELQPNPLPDSTLRAQVFADIAPTNMGHRIRTSPAWPASSATSPTTWARCRPTSTATRSAPCTRARTRSRMRSPSPVSMPTCCPCPIAGSGGNCVSDADGLLTIPHLGTNRYALSVTPPDGQTWIQTTTLEGNHDFDAWLMEGSTGFDTEFVLAGEPVPQPIFGFVPPTQQPGWAGTGHIKGVVVGIKTYTPPKGGAFDFWGGNTGTKIDASDRQALAFAGRPAGRRRRRLDRTGQRRRHVRHHQRARRQLHAELVGRAAELQPQHDQRDRQRR